MVACDVYFPTPIASASLCLLVGGSACGALILTRHWSRDGLILSTALCGGLMVMAGLDYFCEEWRLMEFLWHQVLRLGKGSFLLRSLKRHGYHNVSVSHVESVKVHRDFFGGYIFTLPGS